MARTNPFDHKAEEYVLGAIIKEPNLIVKALDGLDAIDFHKAENFHIFSAMKELNEVGQSIDYLTLSSQLTQMNLLDKAGGTKNLSAMSQLVTSTRNFDDYLVILQDLSIKRVMMQAGQEITDQGYDGEISADDYIRMVESRILEVSRKRSSVRFEHIRKIAEEVVKHVEENMGVESDLVGLSTDYEELNRVTQGLQAGNMIILAARPGMGKTALALNLATNIAKSNKDGKATVAVFSLEMPNDQLVTRILASESSISGRDIRSASNFDSEKLRLLRTSAESLGSLNIYFDDSPGLTVHQLTSKCRNLHQQQGLDFIVIDYLQLLTEGGSGSGNRQVEVSNISRTLKRMALDLEIPVLALSQLSRAVEQREDKRPILADLRESGSIEQDADVIMFIYREDYYDKKKKKDDDGEEEYVPTQPVNEGVASLLIRKNRHGNTGEVKLRFNMANSQFKDYLE